MGTLLETMEAKQMEVHLMSDEKKEVAVVEADQVAPAGEVTMEMVMHEPNAKIVSMRKLLEGGVHYGHQTRRWDPRMAKFIYGNRNGIYIIDLVKTIAKIEEAYAAMKKIVEDGGKVLFVGTNEKYRDVISEEALRSGSFFINNRWLGGTLTNFKTIQGRIRFLRQLEEQDTDGSFDRMPKKEVSILKKEKDKLSRNLEGIKEMRKVPNAVFVIDPTMDHNAVSEARILHIPVFAIVDTNANPDNIDFPIPANDDLTKSVRLITSLVSDAIVEAKGGVAIVAYTKDEQEEVTMKDVIKQADKENAEKLAAIRAQRKEKQERFERMQAERGKFKKDNADDDHYQIKGTKHESVLNASEVAVAPKAPVGFKKEENISKPIIVKHEQAAKEESAPEKAKTSHEKIDISSKNDDVIVEKKVEK